MKKWLLRILLVIVVIALALAAYGIYTARSHGFLRLPSYDHEPPRLPPLDQPAVLVFSKTNSYIHKEAIPAAKTLFAELAADNGWSIYLTDNAAVHNPVDLAKFDTIVWNNVTGDVLTENQRRAMKAYLEQGGGWLGIHGAGDSSSDWDWYKQTLVGADFNAHPLNPQFLEATIHIEQPADPVTAHLGATWQRTDEWYSFHDNPRDKGYRILATLDEDTYSPIFMGEDISMGKDHPIIWKHCQGRGRALYSALGHTAESYEEPGHRELLRQALIWTAGMEGEDCNP